MGVLDLCILALLDSTRRALMAFLCVCADGEDNRGASTGGLRVQPRHDQLCHHPATRQPERGREAAVDFTGPQLDTPTVRKHT